MNDLPVAYQILIVIIASLISGMVGIIISNIYHKKAVIRAVKFKTLQNLFGYKYQLALNDRNNRKEFNKAMNEVPIVFHDSKEVLKAHKELYEAVRSTATDHAVSDDKFITLYKSILHDLNIKIEKYLNDADFLKLMF